MTGLRDTRWIRLYRPGPLRVLLIGLAAFGTVAVAMVGSVVVAATRFLGERLVVSAVAVGAVGLALWSTSRLGSSGVWVGPQGIRVITPLHRRRASWPEVRLEHRADGVWCVPLDGPDWRTPVRRRAIDFAGRAEAYDIAVTALVDWSDLHRS